MAIWVIGKQGMLAKSFIKFLQSEKISYLATSRDEVNITDPLSISQFLEANHVEMAINCAAFTDVDGAERRRGEADLLNREAPLLLGKALTKKHARLIHFSTDFVFDGDCKSGFNEESDTLGQTAYGQTKLAGDKALLSIGGNILIIRVSWLYGEGENHFVSKIIKKLQAGEKLTVVDDHYGSLTLASEVVDATWQLKEETGLFHFSGRGQSSWYEVACFIADNLEDGGGDQVSPIKYADLKSLTPRPVFSYLNCDKYEKATGERIKPWQESLLKFLKERSYACTAK